VKPQLAVDQRQIPKVFAISESAIFLIIVGLGVFIPENVESVKERLGTSKQQVRKLRLAVKMEADDLSIQHAAETFQVASQSLAQTGESS
jgi:hypothetical protein